MTLKILSFSKNRYLMFHCLGDYDDSEPLLFWRVFSLTGFCHKSEKASRKKANIEAETACAIGHIAGEYYQIKYV